MRPSIREEAGSLQAGYAEGADEVNLQIALIVLSYIAQRPYPIASGPIFYTGSVMEIHLPKRTGEYFHVCAFKLDNGDIVFDECPKVEQMRRTE
jgi:hypothetical protein